MGFFTFAAAGGGLILMGTLEAISSSTVDPSPPSTHPQSKPQRTQFKSSFIYFLLASILSFLFILNSLVSFFDALNSNDRVGSAQQLQVLAIAALFFLYSITGLLVNFTNSSFPSSLLNLIVLFGFVEEFMYFYLQRKDTAGIENRYFDLLLVPIFVCVFSTVLELHNPKSVFPKLARGVGLALQGLWFLQMGLSIYTHWMAHGCSLKEKSRGNYTVKCKGHPEYHRARAIATLQFNCHLALIVVLVVGLYSIVARKTGVVADFSSYKPLGAEMQHQIDSQGQFTLDSEDDSDEEVREEGNVVMNKAGGEVELGVNGNGTYK
ncbi:hypothetical protein RchiOBHm_Chr2g0170271 [Rosa chinensis]|uniref:Uncharacterized protein n=1 Tax=Rosa chinensis TaxID=74649 RepID=A0A2P6S542_ROSCH|nr:uncharacterized protein LOC112189507 [Rosa chinensis]XP_024184616.1 uncharacterized protein LOC112189507 [Rosa chinensis]PRQ53782.1 hypothetical protein RchiOBHm_Chr2g0170271 [Rosa chinensis]